jgi:hypothetical protein
MTYVATYYVHGQREPLERRYGTLDGALRFQVRGMSSGEHFVGTILDDRGRTIASHEWLLDHWSEILRYLVHRHPPSDYPPVRALPD